MSTYKISVTQDFQLEYNMKKNLKFEKENSIIYYLPFNIYRTPSFHINVRSQYKKIYFFLLSAVINLKRNSKGK